MKKKLSRLIQLLLCCQLHAAAQTGGYQYEAGIQSVDSSGLYDIIITPQLNQYIKTDYSDLRIINDTGKWVPHLLRFPGEGATAAAMMVATNILEKENTATQTKIILEGNAAEMSNLALTIKNTAAKRYCTLSGSDDKNNWFVINDSIEAIPVKNADNNNSSITLLFPPVSYRYFRVLIHNNGKEPLNILGARTERMDHSAGNRARYQPVGNPPAILFQKDSGKMSYIRVEQTGAFHFDRFSLIVKGEKYFNRFAELYVPAAARHSFANPGKLVQVLNISNNSTLQFKTAVLNAKTFYILIHNYDNLPLKVEAVQTAGGYCVATAYLEKSKIYKLLFGNAGATAPEYDLETATLHKEENLPVATTGAIVPLQKQTVTAKDQGYSKSLIWMIISLAAIVLTFFTYRLVKDMEKRES